MGEDLLLVVAVRGSLVVSSMTKCVGGSSATNQSGTTDTFISRSIDSTYLGGVSVTFGALLLALMKGIQFHFDLLIDIPT